MLPGDIVSLPRPKSDAHTVPCDIVLLRGECVVNESLLTGESVPQIKESLLRLGASGADMRAPLSPHDRHKNYVLCGGTQILLASCKSSSSSSSADEANGAVVSSSGSGSGSTVPGAQYESVMAKIKSTQHQHFSDVTVIDYFSLHSFSSCSNFLLHFPFSMHSQPF